MAIQDLSKLIANEKHGFHYIDIMLQEHEVDNDTALKVAIENGRYDYALRLLQSKKSSMGECEKEYANKLYNNIDLDNPTLPKAFHLTRWIEDKALNESVRHNLIKDVLLNGDPNKRIPRILEWYEQTSDKEQCVETVDTIFDEMLLLVATQQDLMDTERQELVLKVLKKEFDDRPHYRSVANQLADMLDTKNPLDLMAYIIDETDQAINFDQMSLSTMIKVLRMCAKPLEYKRAFCTKDSEAVPLLQGVLFREDEKIEEERLRYLLNQLNQEYLKDKISIDGQKISIFEYAAMMGYAGYIPVLEKYGLFDEDVVNNAVSLAFQHKKIDSVLAIVGIGSNLRKLALHRKLVIEGFKTDEKLFSLLIELMPVMAKGFIDGETIYIAESEKLDLATFLGRIFSRDLLDACPKKTNKLVDAIIGATYLPTKSEIESSDVSQKMVNVKKQNYFKDAIKKMLEQGVPIGDILDAVDQYYSDHLENVDDKEFLQGILNQCITSEVFIQQVLSNADLVKRTLQYLPDCEKQNKVSGEDSNFKILNRLLQQGKVNLSCVIDYWVSNNQAATLTTWQSSDDFNANSVPISLLGAINKANSSAANAILGMYEVSMYNVIELIYHGYILASLRMITCAISNFINRGLDLSESRSSVQSGLIKNNTVKFKNTEHNSRYNILNNKYFNIKL